MHLTPVLYEPLLHIPLMILPPGKQDGRAVHIPTSAVDVLPTLLHLAGQPVPEWCEGRILPGFGDQTIDPGRSIWAVEAKSNHKYRPLTKASLALIKGRLKLTRYFGHEECPDSYELYDVEDDPEELVDLYPQGGTLASEMQAEMLRKLEEVNAPFLARS